MKEFECVICGIKFVFCYGNKHYQGESPICASCDTMLKYKARGEFFSCDTKNCHMCNAFKLGIVRIERR